MALYNTAEAVPFFSDTHWPNSHIFAEKRERERKRANLCNRKGHGPSPSGFCTKIDLTWTEEQIVALIEAEKRIQGYLLD